MDRHDAVTACVTEMQKCNRFSSSNDDQKYKATAFLFDKLHKDAEEYLPMGASEHATRQYVKAALKRVHGQVSKIPSEEFEVANGFPILLVLGLIPTLWSWWKLLKEWMNW